VGFLFFVDTFAANPLHYKTFYCMPNAKSTITHFNILTSLIAFTCMSVSLYVMGLWIFVFDMAPTQAERVAIYHSYFPEFFHSRWALTLFGIALCGMAITLSIINLMLTGLWRILNLLILIISGLMLSLHVFSMM